MSPRANWLAPGRWTVWFEFPVLPAVGISMEMHDGHDYDGSRGGPEKNAEWESPRKAPAHIGFHNRVELRMDLNPVESVLNGGEKTSPEVILLCLVPRGRVVHLRLCFGMKSKPNSSQQGVRSGEYFVRGTKLDRPPVHFPTTPADFLTPRWGQFGSRACIKTLNELFGYESSRMGWKRERFCHDLLCACAHARTLTCTAAAVNSPIRTRS